MAEERRRYDFAVTLKKEYNSYTEEERSKQPYSIQYIPWILNRTSAVYRKHHKVYDFGELLSVAFTAAVKAEQTYDPTRAKFTSFARHYVDGELRDYVSNMTKSQLSTLRDIKRFSEEYFKENKAYPSKAEVLKELKISEETFRGLVNSNELCLMIDDDDEYYDLDSTENELELNSYYKIIDEVDLDYKGVLRMRLIDELTIGMIQRRLKMQKVKVEKLYKDSINALRTELESRGVHPEDLIN